MMASGTCEDTVTLAEIERALEDGKLFVRMMRGTTSANAWRCRRNGKTQLWKTRPTEFRIPVKAGMYTYGNVTQFQTIVRDDENDRWIVEG